MTKINFAQFHTKDAANEGVMLKLTLPDGTPTEEWLHVVSQDSDAYAKASADLRKKMLKSDSFDAEISRLLSAHCVTGWSAEEPCTPEAVATLLKNAPYIQREVELLIYDTKRFFAARA